MSTCTDIVFTINDLKVMTQESNVKDVACHCDLVTPTLYIYHQSAAIEHPKISSIGNLHPSTKEEDSRERKSDFVRHLQQ